MEDPKIIGSPKKNGKSVDWTGVQINEFLIIERIPWQKGWNNSKYRVKCINCGKEFIKYPSDIKRIKHSECKSKNKYIGKTYGKLKILNCKPPDNIYNETRYLCKCIDCGIESWRTIYSIKNNKHKCQDYPHIGESIGVYDIIKAEPKDKNKDIIYVAKCRKCGKIKKSSYNHLKRDCSSECNHITKYGHLKVDNNYWSNNRIRDIFYGMLQRCYDKSSNPKSWNNYGGKGIKVCKEWRDNPKSFENWSLENGYEDDLTIDRIDSNKDYCPENCQWVTAHENYSKSGSKYITVDGITKNQLEWSLYLGKQKDDIGKYARTHSPQETQHYIHELLKEME